MTSQNLQFPATSSPSRNTPTSQGSSVEPHPPSTEDESFVDAFGEQAYRIFIRAPNGLYFLGTLTLGRRGESTFFGQTARAEVGRTCYLPSCSGAYLASFSVSDQCKTSTMATESELLIELCRQLHFRNLGQIHPRLDFPSCFPSPSFWDRSLQSKELVKNSSDCSLHFLKQSVCVKYTESMGNICKLASSPNILHNSIYS